MTALEVRGLQLDLAWEDPPENLRRAEAAIARAAAGGGRLMVLPEMFATGFSMRAEAMAEHAGTIAARLAELARAHGVWLLAGLAEPGTPRPYNAAVLFDPSGTERLRYRKIHPFSLAREHEHFCGGEGLATVAVEGVRVTPLVCYDLRFPEPFRIAAAGTDLFVVIANWPEPRRDAWSTLLRARAIEDQAFVLGVNRVGEGAGLVYSGDSALIGPLGDVRSLVAGQVAECGGRVSAAEVTAARERFSFLADRRPEVYSRLAVNWQAERAAPACPVQSE